MEEISWKASNHSARQETTAFYGTKVSLSCSQDPDKDIAYSELILNKI
jgi:hypothetical protein